MLYVVGPEALTSSIVDRRPVWVRVKSSITVYLIVSFVVGSIMSLVVRDPIGYLVVYSIFLLVLLISLGGMRWEQFVEFSHQSRVHLTKNFTFREGQLESSAA